METVEDLLKEKKLTLTTTISRCRSHEAVWKQCSDITWSEPSTVAAARVPVQMITKACSDCGGTWHKAGHQQCPPCNQIIYVLTTTKLVILQKYAAASKHCQLPLPTNQELMLSMLRLQNRFNCFYWHNNSPSQPLNTMVSTFTVTHEITVLPDSGGRSSDISSRNWNHGIFWLPSR